MGIGRGWCLYSLTGRRTGGISHANGSRKVERMKKNLRSTLIKKLDDVFSKYIRLKYSDAKGYCRCISCGKWYYWKDIQNGHYMSRRYFSTRWNEDNCRPQCVACNIFNQGNIQAYRRNLISEIGVKRVDLVEVTARIGNGKFSTFELEEMIKYYTALASAYESEKK